MWRDCSQFVQTTSWHATVTVGRWGTGSQAPGLAAIVWTCGLSAEVAQVWTSQDSPKHNLLIFHLIYHNLNTEPSWWRASLFSWPYTPFNILVIQQFESYFFECWYKCKQLFWPFLFYWKQRHKHTCIVFFKNELKIFKMNSKSFCSFLYRKFSHISETVCELIACEILFPK